MSHDAIEESRSAALLRLVFGYQISQAIHVAATLGLADLLANGPRDVDDLAADCGADASALHRLLRALSSVRVFYECDGGQFALTPLSECLRTEALEPVGPVAEFIGRPAHWQAHAHLLHSVLTGENAFQHVHGVDVWTYRATHPEEGAIFDRATSANSRRQTHAVLAAYDFGRFGCVVDVGGGQGSFLAALLAQHGGLRGVLFDQPWVVSRAGPILEAAGVGDRCRVLSGSFFHEVPSGGDAYILKSILHDWDDAEATTILRSCRRGIGSRGRLIVLERIIAPPNEGAFANSATCRCWSRQLAGRALDEGQTLIVDDVRVTPGTALPALLTGETAGSEIAAPIIAGDVRLGVVKAFSPKVRRFNPDDASLLTSLAAAAAVALTNARLFREAQDAIEARDEFLSAAAHDLSTPLAAVKGTAQLLRRILARGEVPANERVLAGLESIDATATKMGRQLEELVSLSRMEVGAHPELRCQTIDLVELVKRIAAEQQRLTERHHFTVRTAVPMLSMNADAVRLGRLLDNLVSNAIKYSPNGGDINIHLTVESGSAGMVAVLTVQDYGIGIPAADLAGVFDRFSRAANVKGRIPGTGIGLASARQIVEQHSGTISVESADGAGSTFTVRLPVCHPN